MHLPVIDKNGVQFVDLGSLSGSDRCQSVGSTDGGGGSVVPHHWLYVTGTHRNTTADVRFGILECRST